MNWNEKWLMVTVLSLLMVAACGDTNGETEVEEEEPDISFASSMEPFESDEEFEQFWQEWADYREQQRSEYDDGNEGESTADADAAGPAPAADGEPDNEDITNTQEEGVDEGGIVKNVGDYLVVLRRGALYSVDVSTSGQVEQIDALRVAAEEGLNSGVWYDEMLVHGSRIYVIGYRYGAHVVGEQGQDVPSWIFGATEVSSFSIDADGQLTRGHSTFFESNDYYSGTNYASRLVDGKLIFYMPFWARFVDSEDAMPHFPTYLHHQEDNAFTAGKPLFNPTDVIKPLELPDWPIFHTVIQCELPEDLTVDCSARSLISNWSREFYVSRDRIYLWNNENVFALSQTDGDVATHTVRGYPRDQFAFREVDAHLYVGVTRRLEEDEMDEEQLEEMEYSWDRPQVMEMLALPLEDFDQEGGQSLDGKVEPIAEDVGWTWMMRNRHVGDWYLVAIDEAIHAHHLASGETTTLDLGGRVSRIEATPGIGALLVYNVVDEETYDQTMVLDSLLLGDEPKLQGGAALEGMREGEHRSHGFFFRPDDEGGLFGLPILDTGSGWGWWGSGVSNIGFFRADTDGEIDFRGAVSSSTESTGDCATSCIDWYGNTRPIFLFGRIYALMGSEIVEVDVTDDVGEVGERVILELYED